MNTMDDITQHEIDTGVTLPDDGIVDIQWASAQLSRTDAFSTELLNYGRGKVFFLLQESLGTQGFEQAVSELKYTVETALTYIAYLQKKPLLDAIKKKYYVALSLSAAKVIPDTVEETLALCDVCTAKYGKLTADNLTKAAQDTGMGHKKMSDSAVGIEAMKKKALHEWLKESYQMTDADISSYNTLKPEGLVEFTEKMANAFDRLDGFDQFYDCIVDTVFDVGHPNTVRFLADLKDAASSIEEFLTAEKHHSLLVERKEKFEQEVYPEIQLAKHKELK